MIGLAFFYGCYHLCTEKHLALSETFLLIYWSNPTTYNEINKDENVQISIGKGQGFAIDCKICSKFSVLFFFVFIRKKTIQFVLVILYT